MRIIGGEARGRRLVAPEGTDTRPTADKTRESLFNILMRDVPEARALDLFGGTGALALEAMSRGAKSAVICDVSVSALKAIQVNVRSVMKDHPGVRVIKADYRAALKSLAGEAFDLIFLDPPYRLKEAYAISAQLILEHSLLAPGGILIAERSGDTPITWPAPLVIKDTRTYRDTAIDFVVLKDDPTEDNA